MKLKTQWCINNNVYRFLFFVTIQGRPVPNTICSTNNGQGKIWFYRRCIDFPYVAADKSTNRTLQVENQFNQSVAREKPQTLLRLYYIALLALPRR